VEVIKMNKKFNLSKVKLSRYDTKRGLTFPETLTEELAEFIGIMIGDGHLSILQRTNKLVKKFTQSDVVISGNCQEKGHLDHIRKLFYSLFNRNLFLRKDKRSNSILMTAHSRGIVHFLNLICGIPIGRKTDTVKIPEVIKNSNLRIKYAFLRGLADTDYYIAFKRKNKYYNYPVIRGTFKSTYLVKDIEELYKEIGFIYCVSYNVMQLDTRFNKRYLKNHIYLNGKENLTLWMKLIGFSHPKIRQRIKMWQEEGNCPPAKASGEI